MTKQEAIYFILSKSEQGQDGMTIVRLGYVYSLLDKIFDEKMTKCAHCGKEIKAQYYKDGLLKSLCEKCLEENDMIPF